MKWEYKCGPLTINFRILVEPKGFLRIIMLVRPRLGAGLYMEQMQWALIRTFIWVLQIVLSGQDMNTVEHNLVHKVNLFGDRLVSSEVEL